MTTTRHRTRGRAATPALLLTAGAAVSALALAGCAAETGSTSTATGTTSGTASAAYPVTVTSCGQDFTYDEAPSRVVLGSYRTFETLDALGVAGSVHGYLLGPDDDGVAPTDLPDDLVMVSADTIPAREPVIAAEPDLFLSYNEAQLTGEGTLSYDDLSGIGANAYVMGAYCAQDPDNLTIDSVYADITALGAIYDVPERASELNDELRARVATAEDSLDGSTATVAVLKVIGGTVYAIGGYPAAAILSALGLTNQFADLATAYAELSTEQALAMDPDVVLVNYVGDEQTAIDQLATLLPDLPAVQDGRVYGADESPAQGGGVGIIDSLESIATDVAAATR
ncbi:MAG TPA: ABC transporter substrate-binding protein [Cellulomonas sp.]